MTVAIAKQQSVKWCEVGDDFGPYILGVDGKPKQRVQAAPLPGSQDWFTKSPVFETLIEGPRGTAKSTALLLDFLQDVGTGLGEDWTGVLFRPRYKAFQSFIRNARKLIEGVWGDQVSFTNSPGNYKFTWKTGETLHLHVLEKLSQAEDYQGQEFGWIGFDELTNWATLDCYLTVFPCCRSDNPRVRCRVRSACNPGGPGHNAVKERFRLPVPPGQMVGPRIKTKFEHEGKTFELERCAIHSTLAENLVLMRAQPDYVAKIAALARRRGGQHLIAAWIHGSWDIIAGGMFDDLWMDGRHHRVPDVPMDKIPRGWRIDRSFDHGRSAPFSVGWWAESNGVEWKPWGEDKPGIGRVKGDIVRIGEWYGWTGEANEGCRMLAGDIAKGIVEREQLWGIHGRVRPGAADSSIFDDYEPGKSVAGDMAKHGVRWERADKSRKQGWEQFRKYLDGAIPKEEGERTHAGMYVCERCYDGFIRTVPALQRDEKDPDDANTDMEDHCADEVRYRVRTKRRDVRRKQWK